MDNEWLQFDQNVPDTPMHSEGKSTIVGLVCVHVHYIVLRRVPAIQAARAAA